MRVSLCAFKDSFILNRFAVDESDFRIHENRGDFVRYNGGLVHRTFDHKENFINCVAVANATTLIEVFSPEDDHGVELVQMQLGSLQICGLKLFRCEETDFYNFGCSTLMYIEKVLADFLQAIGK